jgi:TIR domain
MALTEIQRNVLGSVVERFVNFKTSTERIALVREFEDPDAIDQLHRWQLLKTFDVTNYLPTALSFHYCGHPELEALAKRGAEVLVEVFRNMYLRGKIDFTPEGLREAAAKIDKHADEQMIRLGLYVSPDLRLLSGWTGGNPQQPDISPTEIYEGIVKLKKIDTIWDNYIHERIPWPVQDSMGGIVPRHSMFTAQSQEGELMKYEEPSANQGLLVLISHSSKDKVLAEALIDLLRSGLGLLPSQIRCSSVDGYRLPAGVDTHDQLRKEIKSVKVLIGLLTPNSLSSTYVLFELGARWGAGLFMIPLLAATRPEEMRGPHGVLNALTCETEGQLIQLVEDAGKELLIKPQSASSYLKQLGVVKALADSISVSSRRALNVTPQQPSLASQYEAKPRKPNLIFLHTHSARLRFDNYEGEGFYESENSQDPYGVVACFRNEPSPIERVIDVNNVRAQVIYRNSNGVEIGRGIPRACWEGHKYDLIDFPVGQSHCAILMMVFNDGRLLVPWKERSQSADSWMGGDTITTRDLKFSRDTVATIELRLIGDNNEMLLPALNFDFSTTDGKPSATLKQQ